MVVEIKERKSLDRFLKLASEYRENASKKEADKKIFLVALLAGILMGVFWLFGYMIGSLELLLEDILLVQLPKAIKVNNFTLWFHMPSV
jgi:hypothetical protein